MTTLPRVDVIGTGGTMSYVAKDRLNLVAYNDTGHVEPISALLSRLPEVAVIADVRSETFFEEDFVTSALGPAQWPALAALCNDRLGGDEPVAGLVVTHGSAFLEETAYFLNLTVRSTKPVVLTAAQRPMSGIGTDAELNLFDAIRVAADAKSHSRGVLVVMNSEIHAARDVTKSNTLRLETMHPRELGYLGYADSDGKVVFYRRVERLHTMESEFSVEASTVLPDVAIAYVHAGIDERMVDAIMTTNPDGLVVAAGGSGGMPPRFRHAITVASHERDIPIVISSRVGNGRVVERPSTKSAGFIVADNLSAQKARVLLMLGLLRSRETSELQRMFWSY